MKLSALNQFKTNFICSSKDQREQLICNTIKENGQNSKICNLLKSVDVNETTLSKKMVCNNIHFVCLQLVEFSEFNFASTK